LQQSSTEGYINMTGSGGLNFRMGSGFDTRMTVTSSGNVGIGTTSPVRQLSIEKNGTALASLVNTAGGSCQLLFGDSVSDTQGRVLYDNNGDYLTLYANGSEYMRIDAYGGLNIKSVGGTQAATFGGSNLVNGITALPSSAGVPFVVGRDTGSLKSATFAGHVNINTGYGLSFDSGANYLDDYEEGTWTPSPNYGTVSAIDCIYTKIGNTVHVSGALASFSDYTTTEDILVSGLPFTSGGSSTAVGAVMYRDVNNSLIADLTAYVGSSSSNVRFYVNRNDGGGWTPLQYNDFDSGLGELYFSITYRV